MPYARYRYRIEPTQQQREHLARVFGCVRLVWNQALEHCHSVVQGGGKTPSGQQLSKWLTQFKATRSYLQEAPSTPLQESVLNLGGAWRRYWTHPERVKAPKFHLRRGRQSARFTRRTFRVEGSSVLLQKMPGKLKVRWSRPLPSEPSSAVVMLEPSGHYFISFTVEVEGAESCVLLPESEKCVGIDLGVVKLASLSTGEQFGGLDFTRIHERVRKLQRRLERSVPGSGRGERLRRRLARLHGRVVAQRTNALHQLSTQLIRRFDLIAIEDLKTASLLKAPRSRGRRCGRAAKAGLNRAIASMGWGQLRRLLEQKAERYGKRLVLVHAPGTSQRCSACGDAHALNRLSQARFACRSCGHTENADINAAKNILAAGQAAAGQGAGVSPPQQVAAG